jgi:hypothetical protein
MKTPPDSAAELRDDLAAMFPTLPRDFGVSGESVFEAAGPTFQSVLRDFAHFFAREVDRLADRQLRRLAELVVRCMASPGPLQDAMDICFLQQIRQLKVNGRIEPLIAAAEKAAGK